PKSSIIWLMRSLLTLYLKENVVIQFLFEYANTQISHEGRKTYLEGVFLQSNVVNQNRRRYSRELLSNIVDGLQSRIKEGSFFGELNHSQEAGVNYNKVSHVIKSLRRNGDSFMGRAEVIKEGCGRILQSIIDAGGKIGMSSKSTGSLK